MADGKRVDSLMDQVWKFFTSIKLAIFIIIILAIASIIGTIIEQNQPLEKYRQVYTDGAIRLFESLNLFDMYHSWWFLLLLVLFTETIIEQNQPLEKYRQVYTDGAIRLFESLNLFDMYHSWWFLLLLVLFT